MNDFNNEAFTISNELPHDIDNMNDKNGQETSEELDEVKPSLTREGQETSKESDEAIPLLAIEGQETSKESNEVIPMLAIDSSNTTNSNVDETGPSPNNFSSSLQDSPLLNSSDNEQYLNNNFFNDEKPDQNNDGDHLFDLTPDQQQAFRELELRRQQSDYDDDYDYSLIYDDVPEYDVREKLQTLNAQLANEPLPPDPEHRNSKVAFKNEIVSVVAPTDYYDQSESEHEDTSYTTGASVQGPLEINSNEPNISPVLVTENINQEATSNVETAKTTDEHQNDEKIDLSNDKGQELYNALSENRNEEDKNETKEDMVVSRGGRFHLMGEDEITDGSNNIAKNDDEKSLNEVEINRTVNRPVSAPPSKRKSNDQLSNSDSASSNVNPRSNSLLQKQSSNTQIPRVDKDALRRQHERKKREQEENSKREEEEQNMRKEMNTKSFNSWLLTKQKLKKEENERKRKEDDEEKKKKEKLQNDRKTIAEEKEKELNSKLENDKRKEDKLKQYRLKEMEDSIIVHSSDECAKAYRDWMKKKHKDYQNKVKEERQRARITRLAMRQCRKSQNLAQAIQQSTSFRYLDFCGYP